MIEFCDAKKSHASHGYFLTSCTDCYVFLEFLFVSQGSRMYHMDIYFFHVQIVYVFLGFLFVLQGSHIYHMDISFLHKQIVSVYLELIFVLQRSYMYHMDIFSVPAKIAYVFLGLLSMQRNHIEISELLSQIVMSS